MRHRLIASLFGALVVAATTAVAGPAASAPIEIDSSPGWEPWTTLDARPGLYDYNRGLVTDDGRIVLVWSHRRPARLYSVVRSPEDDTWPAPKRLDGSVWLGHRLESDGGNKVVSISSDLHTGGFRRLGPNGWGPYRSVSALESYEYGGGVNAAGDVLVMWRGGYPPGTALHGAVYSGDRWTSLPTLEFEPAETYFLHYRLLDDGSVVVVSMDHRGDYSHGIDKITVSTLADGVWTSEKFLRGGNEEFSRAGAATSPAGDVVVWWVRNPRGAPLRNLVATVRPAGAASFNEPKVVSARHQCRTRQRSPCAEATVLDSGKVAITYRSVTADGLGMLSQVRRLNLDSEQWSKPQRLLPERFARPRCEVIADPCDSFDIDLRPDRRAFVYTTDGNRTYDCPTLVSCHGVTAGLEDIDRAQLLARPGSGAVAFRTTYRCHEEGCRIEDFRASVLGP